MSTVLDLITAAILEFNGVAPGEDLPAAEAVFGLNKLNLLLDTWATDDLYVYNKDFTVYTLIPNHQPHTIGPVADFVVTQRPVKIEAANLVLTTSTPNQRIPLGIRDDDWWADQRIRSLANTTPSDLFYSPNWPNGQINLWPVPTLAYGIELETWVLLSKFVDIPNGATALNQTFSFPPGYQAALTYSLAETLCEAFGKPVGPMLAASARNARSKIQNLNLESPRISTTDSGLPRSGASRTGYSFRTGQSR
jgi:hypothetical protein